MFPSRQRLASAVFALVASARAVALEPIATLSPNDIVPPASNGFGWSLAVDGNTIVVGAPSDDTHGLGLQHGAAYVFRWTGSRWVQEAKLYGSQAGFNDVFGWSVALQGSVLIVGQPHFDPAGSDVGVAYVFRRTPAGTWVEEQVLSPSVSQEDDHFGHSVDVDGTRVAVASPGGTSSTGPGGVFVFNWDGEQWTEEAALTGTDTIDGDRFGYAVTIRASRLAVGARERSDTAESSGAVYVFEFDGLLWTQSQKLTASDPATNARFGASVGLHGDSLLVGAPGRPIPPTVVGGVYLFRDLPNGWVEETVLLPSDPVGSAKFGDHLALSGSVLMVAAPSTEAAYLFEPSDNGWAQRLKLQGPYPPSAYGHAVAAGGPWAVVSYGPDVYCALPDVPCIPALSHWGAAFLGLMLLVLGSLRLRRRATIARTAVLLLCVRAGVAQDPRLEHPHHPERLLVRFNPAFPEAARAAAHRVSGGVPRKSYRCVEGLTMVQVDPARLHAGLVAYSNHPSVLYAEPDYYGELLAEPNDTYFSTLWAMLNSGDNLPGDPGTPGADIRATQAWDFWQGDTDFRIAILDTGISGHADVYPNLWCNPAECNLLGDNNGDGCPGVCGVDDDGDGLIDESPEYMRSYDEPSYDDDENGFTDDWYGWNFQEPEESTSDDNKHGTHVSGIVGARGNNALGVTGVNWRCKLVALKINEPNSGSILVEDAIDALDYVIEAKIKLSNNSYRFPGYCQAHYDAILAAKNQVGHLFVAGAGNNGNDQADFPARYDLDNIISVAATNNDDQLWVNSNYGAASVDLGAPGVGIWSTVVINGDSGYEFKTGTSMAAPHVTGVVALLWSKHPTWDWTVVKSRVLRTARPIPALSGKCVTGGVVNAFAAVNDCNLNGIPDDEEVAAQTVPDCNANGVPDWCDITDGLSQDCEPNSVPDECEYRSCCNPPEDPTCSMLPPSCCEAQGGLPTGYLQCFPFACSGYGPGP